MTKNNSKSRVLKVIIYEKMQEIKYLNDEVIDKVLQSCD